MLPPYKTPDERKRQYLDNAIALIIVHTNRIYDPDEVSKEPVQKLIKRDFADYVYEFMAFHRSFVEHNGLRIDNNRCPGDYYIDALAGNDFVLVGGGLDNCLFDVYFTLLAARSLRETAIHLPADSIYTRYQDMYDGELVEITKLVSDLEKHRHRNPFRRYKALAKLIHPRYRVICEDLVADSDADSEEEFTSIFHPPKLRLMIWSSADLMLQYLSEKYQPAER